MDKKKYNTCVGDALRGKSYTKEERKMEFCIASKLCSGKSSSREAAIKTCEAKASQPKPATTSKTRGKQKGGTIRLVLLTTTDCKPCSEAKTYLKEHIDRGDVEILNIQKSGFAADMASKYHIVSVPKLLVVDSEGKPFSELQVVDTEQTI